MFYCLVPRPHYSQLSPCGHLALTDTLIKRTATKSQEKPNYRRLTEIISRCYRLSLMRTLTWGPYSVRYKGSWLYYARAMRFESRGLRKFLRPRQTRRSETFCLTWGGAFGSGRAVNNFSALMKGVQQPWRVQRNEHFYSMHVFIVESRLAFLFHLSH